MTLDFEIESEPTLDGSYPIIVTSLCSNGIKKCYGEEYAFQFAVNKKEATQLFKELKKRFRLN